MRGRSAGSPSALSIKAALVTKSIVTSPCNRNRRANAEFEAIIPLLFAARCASYYTESLLAMICGRFLRGAAIVLAASLTFAQPVQAALAPPFFLYGASFFYERIPRAQWAGALARYREAGINTIDLYVMWNWHEVRDRSEE